MDRLRDLVVSLPLVTVSLTCLNIAIHLYIFLTSMSLGQFAISSYQIIYNFQVISLFQEK